jgi:hypothetical protein
MRVETEDWVMGVLTSLVATWLWPVYVPIWVLRSLYVKYLPEGTLKPEMLFPNPRVKTQAERVRERQQRAEDELRRQQDEFRRMEQERTENLARMRRAINARERELKMELSTWED